MLAVDPTPTTTRLISAVEVPSEQRGAKAVAETTFTTKGHIFAAEAHLKQRRGTKVVAEIKPTTRRRTSAVKAKSNKVELSSTVAAGLKSLILTHTFVATVYFSKGEPMTRAVETKITTMRHTRVVKAGSSLAEGTTVAVERRSSTNG